MITYRVWALDPVRRVWTVRWITANLDDACRHATRLRGAGLRVRADCRWRRRLTVKPVQQSESWYHRYHTAGQMSDRADATKRYKSPG